MAISSLLLYTVINARNQPACVGAAQITPAEREYVAFGVEEKALVYFELVEVMVVSLLYDDKKLTSNYPNEQVQHKMDEKSVG